VLPERRGQGIGAALCERVAAEATRLGVAEVYLYTTSQQALYLRLGWKPISSEPYNGKTVSVMRRRLRG
jgi:N-acetylglutamate synthase-like GNAT family acetyltransferase